MIDIIVYVLMAATILTVIRILLGPTVWDRLLGFNLMSSKLIMIIMICAIIFEMNFLLDIALTYALLGFISTIFITRFVRDKGRV